MGKVNVLWKVYFGFAVLMTIYAIWRVIVMPQLMDITVLVFDNGIGLTGLYGFCFQRKIGGRKIWKIAFFTYLFVDILYYLFRMYARSSHIGLVFLLIVYGLTFLLSLPGYIALYLYAFKRNDIWGETASPK